MIRQRINAGLKRAVEAGTAASPLCLSELRQERTNPLYHLASAKDPETLPGLADIFKDAGVATVSMRLPLRAPE